MSDYLTELRRDLVDAQGRHGRRGSLGRARRVAHPRAWRPAAALVPVAVAACIAAVVLGAGALRDPEPTAALRVVAVLHLGGQPIDATLAAGSLWVADYSGRVIRVDPARRKLLQRIPLGVQTVSSIAGTTAGVWVATEQEPGERGGRLVRVDPRTGTISARVPLQAWVAVLAANERGVWALDSQHDPVLRIWRSDLAHHTTLAPTATDSVGVSLAVASDAVWTLARDGTVVRRDPRSGRVVLRLPQVAGASDTSGDNRLVADAGGAWVINPTQSAIVRIEAGRAVRRIAIASNTLPTLAHTRGALWIATGDIARGGYHLARIDTETDEIATTVDLGRHRPNTLVASPDGLWVIADDGTALLVQADQP